MYFNELRALEQPSIVTNYFPHADTCWYCKAEYAITSIDDLHMTTDDALFVHCPLCDSSNYLPSDVPKEIIFIKRRVMYANKGKGKTMEEIDSTIHNTLLFTAGLTLGALFMVLCWLM